MKEGRSSSKNILMIGPTGVGKTEISRRLSRLAEAPFIVAATRFTGYVGRARANSKKFNRNCNSNGKREEEKEVKAKANWKRGESFRCFGR